MRQVKSLDYAVTQLLSMPPRTAVDIHAQLIEIVGFRDVSLGQLKRALSRLRKIGRATLFGSFAATAWGPPYAGPKDAQGRGP